MSIASEVNAIVDGGALGTLLVARIVTETREFAQRMLPRASAEEIDALTSKLARVVAETIRAKATKG